jgi:hypothetical protein
LGQFSQFTSRFHEAHELSHLLAISSLYGYYVTLSEEQDEVFLLYGTTENLVIAVLEKNMESSRHSVKRIKLTKKTSSYSGGQMIIISPDELIIFISMEKNVYIFNIKNTTDYVSLSYVYRFPYYEKFHTLV